MTYSVWKTVRQTIHEMMRDRQYQVVHDGGEDDMSLVFRSTADAIYVHLIAEPKIGIAYIKDLVSLHDGTRTHHLLVSAEGITPKARKACKHYLSHGLIVEPFVIAELMFNVVRHTYCPRHRVCSDEEKKNILHKLGISETDAEDKLPGIQAQDPIVKYYRAPKGSLIEIVRSASRCPVFLKLPIASSLVKLYEFLVLCPHGCG